MPRTFYKFAFLLLLMSAFAGFTTAQKNDRDTGIELYKKGDFKSAIKVLKQTSKNDPADAQVWYFLGLSYLQTQNDKEAVKSFGNAVKITPNNPQFYAGLAYAHLLRNNNRDAHQAAQKALELNSKNAEAHYILGTINFRSGAYNYSYERAKKAIELSPAFSPAYLLKADSLISSFSQMNGTVVKSIELKTELLKEAVSDLEKYLRVAPNNETTGFYRDYLNSLKFFANYYDHPDAKLPLVLDSVIPANSNSTALKILSKPRPSYTDSARNASVSGIVRLLIGFSANGKIEHIITLKQLSHGLSEAALRAAQKIKFEPATKDGKPISVVKMVEYSFSIY